MAKSSADDADLRKACEAAIDGGMGKQALVLSMRVAKSRGIWGKTGRLGRHMAKPRVLALTTYYLHPAYHYAFELSYEDHLIAAFTRVVERLSRSPLDAADAIDQMKSFREGVGSFAEPSAIAGRDRIDGADLWFNFGHSTPILRKIAVKILSQTSSSSGCERNWSTFALIHTKVRNRLSHRRLDNLVYVHYNMRLRVKHLTEDPKRGEVEDDPVDIGFLRDDEDPMVAWVARATTERGEFELDEEADDPEDPPRPNTFLAKAIEAAEAEEGGDGDVGGGGQPHSSQFRAEEEDEVDLLGELSIGPRAKFSSKGQRTKVFLRVLKYSSGGVLEPAKLYKLKHLTKVEVVPNDPSGCTFMLGFDNLRSQSVSPPQWTMRNIDDRNRLLLCILHMCKEILGQIPKFVGIDIVEMALWAKENKPSVTTQVSAEDGPAAAIMTQTDSKVTVERDLVSQAEEEDMEALLGTYVMDIGEAEAFSERLKRELLALEAANVHALLESEPLIDEVLQGLDGAAACVDDMEEWLSIFNVKLRHMREDIESIESRNNKLEMQSVNNKALIEELDKLLERLRIPSEFAASLTGGSFEEARMIKNIEACEWLTGAIRTLEVPQLDPIYANMRAVKEKRAELEKLRSTFVKLATEFLRTYFSSLVDFMITDKSYFSQRGQLKRPDHADLRYKCRTYARLLQHLKSLDKNCLGPLRQAYCHSLNLLLRREAREFANELRASTKASRNPTVWLEASSGSSQMSNSSDTSNVSEAYSKMLTIFIPLLVDESSFFAHFMCFEVPAFVPPGAPVSSNRSGTDGDDSNDDDLGIMDVDGDDTKTNDRTAELGSLNEALQELLDGIQEDFYAVVDWAYKIDPLRCISMHGITERYLSGQKADAAGFVRRLLDDLETRISMQFNRFVDEACHQIERNERNVRQMGVLSYIPRFATLATRMEQYIQGQSRDLVDQAYTKFVSIMFVTLEKIAQADPKYADIVLLENYAAFQNSLYDLANVVPTLAKFYHQASEAYEQACTRHINTIIYFQFERLFQFARKIEELMFTITPDEIPFQLGLSKMDLRKTLKSSLSGVDKSINNMYRKLQKNLTSEELLPSLWDKCKKEFLDKYESFSQLVAKIYPSENIPSVTEMKELLASM